MNGTFELPPLYTRRILWRTNYSKCNSELEYWEEYANCTSRIHSFMDIGLEERFANMDEDQISYYAECEFTAIWSHQIRLFAHRCQV